MEYHGTKANSNNQQLALSRSKIISKAFLEFARLKYFNNISKNPSTSHPSPRSSSPKSFEIHANSFPRKFISEIFTAKPRRSSCLLESRLDRNFHNTRRRIREDVCMKPRNTKKKKGGGKRVGVGHGRRGFALWELTQE